MLCEYLRHIDLLAVYDQLPAYEEGHKKPKFSNIPPPLCDTLAPYFEWLAVTVTENDRGKIWSDWEPIDVAAEVGDLIEGTIIDLENKIRRKEAELHYGDYRSPAPTAGTALKPGKSLERFLTFSALSHTHELINSADAAHCLLVYQYDALCSLYKNGHFESALAVMEAIAETRETLTHFWELGTREWLKSHEARARAAVRHKETNNFRALADWAAEGDKFSSRRAFARECFKRYGVTDFTTVYNWIRTAHQQNADEDDE